MLSFCSLIGFHKFVIFESKSIDLLFCVFAWISWLAEIKSSAPNTGIYTLSSGSYITHFLAVVMKRENFEQICDLIQANTACRQQMRTIKLLFKYFSIKNFQIGNIFRFKNQIKYYLPTNREIFLETQSSF